ncbi:MAG: hypothetical protein ACM3S5_15780 [Rhodospirillales bacterium]
MTVATYDLAALEERYVKMTCRATVQCVLRTELVGGMSADEDGVRAFVNHHLNLTGDDADKAVARILAEEVGERDATPEGGELDEKLTYGISIIRRDEHGPWIGDWMVKACLKAAASRLGLFVSKRGSKGDMAEMGRVAAVGASLATPGNPERIHLVNPDGTPATTYFQEFKGRIQSPQGAVSIVSHKECVPPGTRFSFEFRRYDGKLKADDIANIFAAAMNIGIGSAKAFERGKFAVESLEIE